MKRKSKIIFGFVTILLAMISAGISFWLLSDIGETYTFMVRFIFRFFLMVAPIFTTLAVINLLKEDK